MKRPLLASLVFGALAALVPTAAAAAPVPIATIAPEVDGLPVDSLEYRVLANRYETTAATLSEKQARVESSAAELEQLAAEDLRLTTQLADQTRRKKEATIAIAQSRAGLRTLAVDTYVNGPEVPDDAADLVAATKMLGAQSLTRAVSEKQVAKLEESEDSLDHTIRTMTADLVARSDGRVRTTVVQAEHDQAVADTGRLTETLVELEDAVERARVTANVVGADFALVAIDAYWKAASVLSSDDPECGIPWWALAGITRVESKHGNYGGARLLANGDVDRRIVGIPLDGTNNTALIADTDGGQYDGDDVYDRAVGPMQFIPSTWRRWREDGNGDGDSDPNNIYDAALAAAHYLCASGPMITDDDMRRGFFSYNHSQAYAEAVLNYAKGYSRFRL